MAPINPAVFLDPTMTTLVVGPEKRKYVVHKELLREKLGYFKSAYNTPMAEATSNIFEIDDVPDLAVRSLMAWLYTGQVYLDPGNTDSIAEDSEDYVRANDSPFEEWKEDPAMEDVQHQETDENDQGPADEDEDEQYGTDGIQDEESGEVENEQNGIDGDEYDRDSAYQDDEVDYEYESGSEPDDTEIDQTDESTGSLPSASEVEEGPEERLVKDIFPDSELSELDAYQIGVLIQFHSSTFARSDPTFVPKWSLALEQKRKEVLDEDDGPLELDVYDCLVDLYIVADRFDCQPLGRYLVRLLDAEQRAQASTLHGQALPTLQTVSKAFESLPRSSELRLWLLYIFAYHWRPSGDSAEQAAARDLLPKEFLLELALTAAERAQFTVGAEDVPSLRLLWIDHAYAPVEAIDPVWLNRGR